MTVSWFLKPYRDLLQVDWDMMCRKIYYVTIQVTAFGSLGEVGKVRPAALQTVAWVNYITQVEANVNTAIQCALKSNMYLRRVIACFESVFAQDTPAKLKRFDTLKDELTHRVLPQRVNEAKQGAAQTIDTLQQQALMQFAYGEHDPDRFKSLDQAISNCLIRFIIQKVKNEPLCLPDDFILAEDADTSRGA